MKYHSRKLAFLSMIVAAISLPSWSGVHGEWPTYQHDVARSGSTAESAPQAPRHSWTYQSPTRPISAWDEPALWDGWSKVYDLKNRQVFDKVFHVAVSNGRVYFGSSVDDQIRCLDAQTGQPIWTQFTEGPVRLAPTIANGRLYVGSDDGYVYCLSAESGEIIWKRNPGPGTRRVAGNGRVISPWAIRTSVVVQDDVAYCGAGVIPSEGVYVVAMNATDGSELWKTEMTDLPAQGYMLASPTRLYVVTSRDTPVVLDAKTGERLYKVKGGTGGTYALLTGDTLIYGPSKTGDVNMIGDTQDVLASFQGNHMIVAQPLSYLQSNEELSSLDRGQYVQVYAKRTEVAKQKAAVDKRLEKAKKAKQTTEIQELEQESKALTQEGKRLGAELKACLKWRTKCHCPFSLVLANNVLIAGGDDEVIAVDAKTGKRLWRRDVHGKAYGLAVSDGKLFVSTDEGAVHCFSDGAAGAPLEARSHRVRHQSYAGTIEGPQEVPAEIQGPFAEFVGPTSIRIEWDTSVPMTSMLRFGIDMTTARELKADEATTRHAFTIDDVQPEVVYRFQVGGVADGREIITEAYRFDAHLNYLSRKGAIDNSAPFGANDAYRAMAKQLLSEHGSNQGYVMVVGAADGRLAYELAAASKMQVVIVEPDPDVANAVRRKLGATKLYGTQISVHQQDLTEVQYGPFLANLIVSESMFQSGQLPASIETLYQSLRPAGGTLILGSEKAGWSADAALGWSTMQTEFGEFVSHKRPRLPGTGEWTHQYAAADNSACSKDDQISGEMMVQWWGRPGARPMPDRGGRSPPPVSANGRLYIQGNRTLFGLDAYNGTILWAKQIPTMRRANMPRDGSNMVADDDHVCVAIRGKCIAFDGQTGTRVRDFRVPEELAELPYDWGYVSRIGSQLFGSAVRSGSQYLGDKGEWYEGFGDKDIAKVTSDHLFAQNAYSGETEWIYSNGVLINSTITIADGRVYFIESRSDAARNAETGRMTTEILQDQVLVSLDATTGALLWEKPFDFSKCQYVTYMTHGNGVLLITGTDQKSNFHTYAFDSSDGAELWEHTAPEKKGHHTGQLAHPTIVGDLVYFNKHTYELRTGRVLGVHNFNWHGCGVMSASNHAVFSRYEYHGMLDLATNQRTEFLGVRSGCWLSLIPSGGLLLAPETSAGCSCGHSIQTSMAYVPKNINAGPGAN